MWLGRRLRAEAGHRDVRGGAARAAVFGLSDGLVSNLALILGVAGVHPAAGVVRLAGLAGLVAGACSMAAGEYVSMSAQRELFERELGLERSHIATEPERETEEMVQRLEGRGLGSTLARRVATAMMSDPEVALEAHARDELGIDPEVLGSPLRSAGASFASFALGAALPLLPWVLAAGLAGVLASVVVAALAAVGVGIALAAFTGRSPVRAALRQLVVSALAAGVAFGVGSALGAAGVG